MKRSVFATLAALCLTGTGWPAPAQDADGLLNQPSANWNVYGAGQTHRGRRDSAVQGGGAMRVTIAAKPANAWDAGASEPIAKAIHKGDTLMLAFWARLESGGDGGKAEIVASIQRSSAPHDPIVTGRVAVTPEWKLVHVQGVVDADHGPGAAEIALSLGTAAQMIDLGPAYVLVVKS